MKTRYRVLVEEKYSKWVEVTVEDPDLIDEEIAAMQECGEIEWDRGEDFDEWNVIEYEKNSYSPCEIEMVRTWCRDMVSAAEIFDPQWVMESMDEYQCQDWLEQMRDRGITIPDPVTSSDLWEAVESRRKEKKQ